MQRKVLQGHGYRSACLWHSIGRYDGAAEIFVVSRERGGCCPETHAEYFNGEAGPGQVVGEVVFVFGLVSS